VSRFSKALEKENAELRREVARLIEQRNALYRQEISDVATPLDMSPGIEVQLRPAPIGTTFTRAGYGMARWQERFGGLHFTAECGSLGGQSACGVAYMLSASMIEQAVLSPQHIATFIMEKVVQNAMYNLRAEAAKS
jgi:hypothetical protein